MNEPAAEPLAVESKPAVRPAHEPPPVVGTRQLISASFDLLLRSGDQMRRASFYVGLIVLGTAGPFALGLWGSLLTGYAFAGLGEPFIGWIIQTNNQRTELVFLIVAVSCFLAAALSLGVRR